MRLRLSDQMIDYIVSRINYGHAISLLDLSYEISERDRSIKFYSTGRPFIYADICLLCDELAKRNHGRMLKKSVTDCIYIGDID
ncbi:DUF3895 domain-containing protein [Macrococcus sp. TMW 2.2395]|nr:DUF3895 domain-containing protein [Macrococcus sp. TMW 2.2395]